MADHQITVGIESAHTADASSLIERLARELAAQYAQDTQSGAGNFKQTDMDVPGAAFVILRMNGMAMGCGAVRPLDEPGFVRAGEIKRMFVVPEWRGQGWAKKILSALEDFARDFGYQQLVLETGVDSLPAIGLYTRMGFTAIECYGSYAGREWSVCMAKTLLGASI